MLEKVKKLLDIGNHYPYYDEIVKGLYGSVMVRNFIFQCFVLIGSMLLFVSSLWRPAAGPEQVGLSSCRLCYLAVFAMTGLLMAVEIFNSRKFSENTETYLNIQSVYQVLLLGFVIIFTKLDYSGVSGMALYSCMVFIIAWITMMKPWQTAFVFAVGAIAESIAMYRIPMEQGVVPLISSTGIGILIMVAGIVVAIEVYHARMRGKLNEIMIFRRYAMMEKQNSELDEQAHLDILTGLGNRFEFNRICALYKNGPKETVGCIYMDANGLHELNNHLGHDAGDEMLKTVAKVILRYFAVEESFRIGGDEFVVLCKKADKEWMEKQITAIQTDIAELGYSVSAGCDCGTDSSKIQVIIQNAENNMRANKVAFYASEDAQRQNRALNEKLENMIVKKRDTDRFLEVIRPLYRDVFFVNLEENCCRPVFMEERFGKYLEKAEGIFSTALLDFSKHMMRMAYYPRIESLCNYADLQKKLDEKHVVKLTYERVDGIIGCLRIYPVQDGVKDGINTLWIFGKDE